MIDDDALLPSRLSQAQLLRFFYRVFGYTRGFRWVLAIALLGSVLNAILEVQLPAVTASAIDRYMVGDAARAMATEGLPRLAVQYLALVLLVSGLSFAVTYAFNYVGQRVVERIRNEVFEHLHRLPMAYFDGNPVGRLVTRVASDTGTLSEFFTGILSNLLCDLLKLLVLLGALTYHSPRLASILLCLIPPLLGAAYAFQRKNTAVNRELRRQSAQLNAHIQENVQGLTTLKSFTAESWMQGIFDRQNDLYYRTEMRLLHLYMLFRPLFASVSMLALAMILGWGGQMVSRGELTLGTLVLFVFYLKMFFAPLDDLAERFNVLQSAGVAAERIFDILDRPVEPSGGASPPPFQGVLEFRDVHFAYTPDKPVLRGVSFRLEPGQKLALVGATGSGKSTITALIQRLYPLEEGGSGQILLDGLDLRDYPVQALRSQLGLIQQDLFLFRASLLHNITLFRQVEAPQLQRALAISRAERVVQAHAEGMERSLGERGQQLSQGERQLVSFARALAGNPPLLILDEATASIDSLTEQAIQEALEDVLEGRSAIIVAHRLSTIQHCDQILVLEQGQVVERGNHQQLMAQNGIYAQLVKTQLAVGGSESTDPSA